MLVNSILETVTENGASKVISVEVEIGEFSFLIFDQVKFCYQSLITDTILEGSELILVEKKGLVQCESCGYTGPIATINDEHNMGVLSFMCPECSRLTRIIEGADFVLNSINMITD